MFILVCLYYKVFKSFINNKRFKKIYLSNIIMSLIETIISIQNYFLVKFGIGQIIFIRKQNILD